MKNKPPCWWIIKRIIYYRDICEHPLLLDWASVSLSVVEGSEFDSDENMDLDEQDDVLEHEAGDADDVGPEEDLRNQVHRVHLWVTRTSLLVLVLSYTDEAIIRTSSRLPTDSVNPLTPTVAISVQL